MRPTEEVELKIFHWKLWGFGKVAGDLAVGGVGLDIASELDRDTGLGIADGDVNGEH